MSFTGNEDNNITLAIASEWTANFRVTITTGDTLAHFFGKENLQRCLIKITALA